MPRQPVLYNWTEDSSIVIPISGKYSIIARGTFGGGTVTVQGSHDGTNFLPFTSAISATSDLITTVEWAGQIRIQLSSSTTPDISISIAKIE